MRYLQIILLFLIAPCGRGQSSHKPDKEINEALLALLKEGDYKVNLMDKVTMPSRTQELMEKFQAAIKKNPYWFLDAQKKVQETRQPLPYDERIGMTNDEYTEFLYLMQNNNGMEMAKSCTESVSIKHINGKITFKGTAYLIF